MGRGDGDGVNGLVDQGAHMSDDLLPIELPRGLAHRRDCSANHQAEMGVATGFPPRTDLADNPFDIGAGHEPPQVVLGVDHQHLVDADVFAEERVGVPYGIAAQIAFADRDEFRPRGHGLGDLLGAVAILNDAAGQEADQPVLVVHHRKSPETKMALVNHGENVAHGQLHGDRDGILDESVDVALDAGDLLDLLLGGHVVMDQAQTAVQRHGDRHPRFGDRVHVRRDDRNLQAQRFRKAGRQIGILRQDLRVERRQ